METPRLVVISAPIRGLSFPLCDADFWTLGRDESAYVHVKDISMAPLHARIARDAGEWFISSLSVQTPLYVNGEPVHEAVLEHRDRLRVGRVEFVLLLD